MFEEKSITSRYQSRMARVCLLCMTTLSDAVEMNERGKSSWFVLSVPLLFPLISSLTLISLAWNQSLISCRMLSLGNQHEERERKTPLSNQTWCVWLFSGLGHSWNSRSLSQTSIEREVNAQITQVSQRLSPMIHTFSLSHSIRFSTAFCLLSVQTVKSCISPRRPPPISAYLKWN